MSIIQSLSNIDKVKSNSTSRIQTLKPKKASIQILKAHTYSLNRITQLNKSDKGKLQSPFSLFVKGPTKPPFCASYPNKAPVNDQIPSLPELTNPTNPVETSPIDAFTQHTTDLTAPNVQHILDVVEVINENSAFKTLRLTRPADWEFQPGQYIEIKSVTSPDKKPAILAIASGIDDDYIEITAKPNANPEHSNYCLNGLPGDQLIITGPFGSNFPVNLVTAETPVYMLGGGSGLTAIKSVMDSLPYGADSKLIYTSKTFDDCIYKDDLLLWKEEGHVISLTQDKIEGFEEGRITEHLNQEDLKPGALYFLCGPESLVVETAAFLAEMGVPRESIYGSLPVTAKEGGPVFRGDHAKMIRNVA